MRTHYDTLGIDPEATQEEVKRAHRRQAVLLHPDRTAGLNADAQAEASRLMADLNAAYTVLSNPRTRAEYDAGLDDQGAEHDEEDPEEDFLSAEELLPALIAEGLERAIEDVDVPQGVRDPGDLAGELYMEAIAREDEARAKAAKVALTQKEAFLAAGAEAVALGAKKCAQRSTAQPDVQAAVAYQLALAEAAHAFLCEDVRRGVQQQLTPRPKPPVVAVTSPVEVETSPITYAAIAVSLLMVATLFLHSIYEEATKLVVEEPKDSVCRETLEVFTKGDILPDKQIVVSFSPAADGSITPVPAELNVVCTGPGVPHWKAILNR